MVEELPKFRYHPDPLETGSVKPSAATCRSCSRARGYIYVGPVYALEEILDELCPWCIADGSAHEKFDAEFTDAAAIGGTGDWEIPPEEVIEEVAYRTPGFPGWQGERWFTHHGDAAAFLGPAGRKELLESWPDAIEPIRIASEFVDEDEWDEWFAVLDRDRGPTAYVFQCLHCGEFGGYIDFL